MYQYLNKVKSFTDKPIYVTEFGCDVDEEGGMSFEQAYNDEFRVQYYKYYMMQIAKAKSEGADIKGVFAWSLMNNFEWGDGLNFRFGITYVDFNDLSRHPKGSAVWWKELIAKMKPESSGKCCWGGCGDSAFNCAGPDNAYCTEMSNCGQCGGTWCT